mgnify:CR=1 FL=1
MFSKLAKWLYIKFGNHEKDAAFLKEMFLKTLKNENELDELLLRHWKIVKFVDLETLSREKREAFYHACKDLLANEAFKVVCDNLTDVQVRFTIKNAQTEWELICGKLSIAVFEKFRDEVSMYASLLPEQQKDFDRFAPL